MTFCLVTSSDGTAPLIHSSFWFRLRTSNNQDTIYIRISLPLLPLFCLPITIGQQSTLLYVSQYSLLPVSPYYPLIPSTLLCYYSFIHYSYFWWSLSRQWRLPVLRVIITALVLSSCWVVVWCCLLFLHSSSATITFKWQMLPPLRNHQYQPPALMIM